MNALTNSTEEKLGKQILWKDVVISPIIISNIQGANIENELTLC